MFRLSLSNSFAQRRNCKNLAELTIRKNAGSGVRSVGIGWAVAGPGPFTVAVSVLGTEMKTSGSRKGCSTEGAVKIDQNKNGFFSGFPGSPYPLAVPDLPAPDP